MGEKERIVGLALGQLRQDDPWGLRHVTGKVRTRKVDNGYPRLPGGPQPLQLVSPQGVALFPTLDPSEPGLV